MADGGQQQTDVTVEDVAARILAAAFSPGAAWWADAPTASLYELDDDGVTTRRNHDVQAVRREDRTEELAGRLINPDKPPRWLKRMPEATRKVFLEWSAGHRMSQKRGDGISELQSWAGNDHGGVAPQRRGDYAGAVALHDAGLRGPLLPLLRLYALQEAEQWPLVRRYCLRDGLDAEACEIAIRRVLFNAYSKCDVTVADRAKELDRGEPEFRRDVNRAKARLSNWLHTACIRFLHAHGWVPETHVTKAISLGHQWKQLSDPRFMDGLDSRQVDAPVLELWGVEADRYCQSHPVCQRKEWICMPLEYMKVHRAYDVSGREAERGRACVARELESEIPCEGLCI